MKTLLLLFVLTVIFIPVSASADDDEPSPQPKSRAKAFAYSVLPTILLTGNGIALAAIGGGHEGSDLAGWAGFWIIAGGVIIGPSLGHVYAERPKPFNGAVIRTGIALLCVGGMALVGEGVTEDRTKLGPGMALVWIGSAGWMISAFWDIATAGRSADRYNQRIESFSLELVPIYLSNHNAPGLAVRISF